MPVQWEKLLAALGCTALRPVSELQTCPLHPHSAASLRVSITAGTPRFGCRICKFEGDAVELVSRFRNVSIHEALALFRTDPQISATQVHNYSDVQYKAYTDARNSQVVLADYVRRCEKALTSDEGRAALATLRAARHVYADIPPDLGMVVTKDLPPQLGVIGRKKYSGGPFVLFAHRWDNLVSGVGIRDLATNAYEYIPTTDSGNGVYPNITITGNQLILTKEERIAASMYSVSKGRGLDCAFVAARHLPLPFKYRDINKIYLWNSPASKYSISDVLCYLIHPEPILGCVTAGLEFYVLTQERDVIDGTWLRNMTRRYCMTAMTWVATELLRIYREHGLSFMAQTLQTVPGVDRVLPELQGALRAIQAPADLLNHLEAAGGVLQDRVTLTNGNIVLRTPTGFRGAHPADGGPTIELSNFSFQTNVVVQNGKGDLFYNCALTVNGQDPADAMLPDHVFDSSSDLRRAISSSYGRRGKVVNPVVSAVKGFDWVEIRNLFSRSVPVQQELVNLGITAEGGLELPGISIPKDGSAVRPQTRLLIPHEMDSFYAGVTATSNTDLPCFTDLWNDEVFGAGCFSLCVSHMIFNIVHRLVYTFDEIHTPAHCLLVDTPKVSWESTLRQFSRLLSGKSEVVRWAPKQSLHSAARLQTLPLPIMFPAFYAKNKEDTLISVVTPVLGVLTTSVQKDRNMQGVWDPSDTAGWTNFITFERDSLAVLPLTNLRVDNLRVELPELLRRTVAAYHNNQFPELFKHVGRRTIEDNPVIVGHQFVRNLLNTKPIADNLRSIVHDRYRGL